MTRLRGQDNEGSWNQEPDGSTTKPRRLVELAELLLSPATRRKLFAALMGSIAVAVMEAAALAAVLPLMELIAGGNLKSGALKDVSAWFGSPSKHELALILAGIVFAAFTIKGVLTILFRWWMLGFIYKQEAETATQLLRTYLTGPYWIHVQKNSAERLRNMNDAVTLTYSNMVVGFISAASESVNAVLIVLVLFILKPLPASFAVAYFALLALVFHRIVRRRASSTGVEMSESAIDSYRLAFYALGGVKEITIRGKTSYFVEGYRATRERFSESKRWSTFLGELPRYVFEVLFIIGIAAMTVIVFANNNSAQAIAILTLFVAAGSQLVPSITRLIASTSMVRVGQQGLTLIAADLAVANDSGASVEEALPPLAIRDKIAVTDLSFRYPGSAVDVLRGVTFEIPLGTTTAVVGPSGAGKTTLVDLILGLYEPVDGTIAVDGCDIAGNLSRWQRSIGVVSQDIYLTDGTLRENIAFGETRDEIDEERVLGAVRVAQLEDFVSASVNGLETMVGERGVRLSGGQRQRIAIARAIYGDPQFLVLDEATSALDNETEHRFTSTLEALRGRLTILVIAHRLSTVRNCDQLIMLHEGQIDAMGSFREVLRKSSRFARLVELAAVGTGEL